MKTQKLTLLLVIMSLIGYCQQTKTQTETQIDTLIPTNGNRVITAAKLRNAIKAAVNYAETGVVGANANVRTVPLIIIIGESNSGGYALNSDATAPELAPRYSVKILNNTTLQFEDLDIGTNNLLGHTGLSNGTTHGLELGLANSVEAGQWSTNSVYLVKTGQGASTVAQWAEGQAYWTTFLTRVNAAKALLKAQGKIPIVYVWHSQGINDAIANTPGSTWKAGTIELFARIRKVLGFVPILTTRLMEPTYTSYNVFLDSLTRDNFVYAVSTTGAGLRDMNHWNYSGTKMIAGRMVGACIDSVGQYEQYMLTQAYKLSVRSIATSGTSGSGSGGGGSGTVGEGNGTPLTWGNFANTNEVSNYLTYTSGGTPAGARAVETVDATQDFTLIVDLFSSDATSAVVTFLDDDNTNNFTWDGSNSFVTGIYHYGDAIHAATGGSVPITTGATISAYPAKIRLHKSGNDVIYELSVNGGTSYTTIYTHTGVLAGKTTLYVKSIFAVPTTGNRVKVSKI